MNARQKQDLEALKKQYETLEYVEGCMLAFEDPWYFLTGYPLGEKWDPGESRGFVFTQDEHDDNNPIKRFPNKEYLWRACYEWYHSPDKKIVYAKSRQIMISWLLISLHLWLCMKQRGSLIFFQNKKEEDSVEMLRRAFVIYDLLPGIIKKLRPLKSPRNKKQLEIEWFLSRIRAIPQGPDVLRQNTATAILSDEMAFQDDAEDAYGAAKPTISGGGRFTAASTANGKNFFFSLWNDDEVHFEQRMKGFKSRVGRNGFTQVEIHYSADPTKDPDTEAGAEWVAAEKKDMTPEAWDREYEINFNVGGGHRLLQGFNRIIHAKSLSFNSDLLLIRGWDFGYLHPAVLWAQINLESQLAVLREYMGWDITIYKFAPEVKDMTKEFFPNATRILDVCDPAGTQKTDKNEYTTIELMRKEFGINPRFNRISRQIRLEWVRKLLMIRDDGKPGMLVDEKNCPILIEGMSGGYVSKKNNPDVPEEDGWFEHTQDVLQYILSVIFRRLGLTAKLSKDQETRRSKGRTTSAKRFRPGVRSSVTGY